MTARLGPRPLALHLAAAQTAWTSSLAGLTLLSNGSPGWKGALPAEHPGALASGLGPAELDRLTDAVGREIGRRLEAFLTGIARYRDHPHRRHMPEPPAVWREGGTCLRDYRPEGGRPVLFVPSLINRAYILDLSPDRSLMRWLAARGFRPLLVDWGELGPAERRFTLTDYVAGRLERALDAALGAAADAGAGSETGGPMPVVGYCMGGLLAAALAQRRPRDVSGLAFLATPWDFHGAQQQASRCLALATAPTMPAVAALGEMPVDLIQALFAALDPLLAARKFMRFATMDPASDEARAFVDLEDWLNDGVPLAAPVAIECLAGWYGGNTPARGTWRIAGEPVRPDRLRLPSLHLIPRQDRIVPPESARALAALMPGGTVVEPPLGHIGMTASRNAEGSAWLSLIEWLHHI